MISPKLEDSPRESPGRTTNWKSSLWRYGLAVLAYVLVVGSQTLLITYSIKISFTIPVVAALLAVSWYCGRRPGLVLAVLFEATTILSNPIPPDNTLTQWIIAQASTFALLVFIVLLTSSRWAVERKVSDSERRYRLLFENNPFPMWAYDVETLRFLNVNNAACESYGYSQNEFQTMTIADIRPEKELSGFLKNLAESPKKIDGPSIWKHLKKDGTVIDAEIVSHEIILEGKRARLVMANDVTERERAGVAVNESESRLAGIIDSAMDAIITVDSNQVILVFNRAAERMFDYPATKAIGQFLHRFVPERFRNGHSSHIQSFGKTGVSTRSMGGTRSVYGLRTNGEEFPLEASISQVEAGGQKLYTVVMRDISKREQAEVRFRQVIEGAPNGMVMVDGVGKIQLVNAEMERLFGYSRDELMGQAIEMLVPARFHKHHADYRKGFAASPSARTMGSGRDLFGVRKNGSEFPVEIGLNPIETEQGTMVLGTIVDITERKRAENRFRLVVEASPSAILMVDGNGLITLVNRQAEDLFGYERDDLIGQPVEILIPERYRAAHPGRRNLFAQNPSARAMGAGRDLYGLRRDGTEVPIEIGLNPISTDEGSFVLASIIDITERKGAEERFKQVIEGAPNGMVMVDKGGAIQLVNAEMEKLFGYVRDELLGRPIEILVPGRFRSNHADYRQGFAAAPSARKMGSGRDLFGLRKDGSEFPVEIGLNPIGTEKGMMILGTIVDITQRKKAEDEIAKLNTELETRVIERTADLEAVNRELEAFSYSVSHDLRAPLRHIDGFVQLLAKRETERLDATSTRYLTVVSEAVGRMGTLIDELLAFSRTSRQDLRMTRVDLNTLVTDTIPLLAPAVGDRTIEWKIAQLPIVKGDVVLLGLVFTNLVSNAIKFTRKREAACIEIGVLDDGDDLSTIFVRDNGAGFDMEYADKLFGVFQRLHREEEFEGIGIGLATVQKIVTRHGGRIRAESQPDKGATFYFTLKKAKGETDEQ